MKKTITAIVALLGAAGIVQASIILDVNSNKDSANFVWTVGALNTTSPTVSVNSGGALASGDTTGGLAGDSFALSWTGTLDWDRTAAQAAGSFGTYLSGLTMGATINGGVNAWGVGPSQFGATNAALVATVDTTGLSAGTSLVFEGLDWRLDTVGDRADILVYDVSADSFLYERWDKAPGGFSTSGIELDNGDMIIIGAMNDGQVYQFDTITMDVIPEPATLGMIVACGGGILFIRRRFII